MVGASPLVSAAFHDEPTIEMLNVIGLEITSVGNHEFDEGIDELKRLQCGGCHPVDGCQDGDPFRGADFTYLAANVVDKRTSLPLLPPFTIRFVDGVPVGFVGMTLKGTPGIVNPAGITHVDFKDEIETANKYADAAAPAGRQVDGAADPRGRVQSPRTPHDPSTAAPTSPGRSRHRGGSAAGVRRRRLRSHAPLLLAARCRTRPAADAWSPAPAPTASWSPTSTSRSTSGPASSPRSPRAT